MNEKHLNITTICSGKGGVGKSFLAANLAYILSYLDFKVLLWDADIYFPNQHIIFGVEPNIRMAEVYEKKTDITNAFFQINKNLTLLADSPAEAKKEKVKPSVLHDVFVDISESNNYQHLIIDTPASGLNEIIQCCSFADTVSIVINDEPTSLLDAYGLIKMLVEYFPPDKIKLIVNNVIDDEDAKEFAGKLNMATKKFLDMQFDCLGFVPYDRMVKQSIIKQELFIKKYSNSDTAQALHKISKNLLSKIVVQND